MTIFEYLNELENQDKFLYNQTMNLTSLVYAVGKTLNCTPDELTFLYDTASLFYIKNIYVKDYKEEQKLIKTIKTNKNVQYANYIEHKLQLIITVCDYYNKLRKTISHLEAMEKVEKNYNLPQIIKNGFKEAFRKYNLINEVNY